MKTATKTAENRANRIAALKRRFPSRNPNKREGAKTIVSHDLCKHIARNVLQRSPMSAARWIRAAILPALPVDSNWYRDLRKLATTLVFMADPRHTYRELLFDVFAKKGNKKLPFAAFSSLPEHDCPGAGPCLKWCYSFRSWRHVSPFCRQLMNSMLLRHRPDMIAAAFAALPKNIDVRLYVDGDFADVDVIANWFAAIDKRPDLRVYGYSKSWAKLLSYADDGGQFPPNYLLNLSTGSKYANPIRDRMQALRNTDGKPVVRGQFVALPISEDGLPRGEDRYNSAEYHKRVRAAGRAEFGKPVFSCPGKCATCGIGAHMCGNPKAYGVIIAIGIH